MIMSRVVMDQIQLVGMLMLSKLDLRYVWTTLSHVLVDGGYWHWSERA